MAASRAVGPGPFRDDDDCLHEVPRRDTEGVWDPRSTRDAPSRSPASTPTRPSAPTADRAGSRPLQLDAPLQPQDVCADVLSRPVRPRLTDASPPRSFGFGRPLADLAADRDSGGPRATRDPSRGDLVFSAATSRALGAATVARSQAALLSASLRRADHWQADLPVPDTPLAAGWERAMLRSGPTDAQAASGEPARPIPAVTPTEPSPASSSHVVLPTPPVLATPEPPASRTTGSGTSARRSSARRLPGPAGRLDLGPAVVFPVDDVPDGPPPSSAAPTSFATSTMGRRGRPTPTTEATSSVFLRVCILLPLRHLYSSRLLLCLSSLRCLSHSASLFPPAMSLWTARFLQPTQGPWRSLCDALDLATDEDPSALAHFLESPSRLRALAEAPDRSIPRVSTVAGVISAIVHGESDVLVRLQDPSGEMWASVQRRAVEEAGPDLAVGSALLLSRVSVFSPAPGSKYLNITPTNIVRVIPADTPVPRKRRRPRG